MYDIAIIGAGVVGAMTARKLSEYDLKICVLEKENDVAMGASKANSAIIHAGFDAKEGTLKAKLNVKGSQMMEQVAKELNVKYRKNGSLVIGFDEEDKETIVELYERGVKNGVDGLEILSKEKLQAIEPNISEEAMTALYAPTGGIICPYELTVAALGNAMDNGCELFRCFEVDRIEEIGGSYEIFSGEKSVKARIVINAAGVYADKIARLAGDSSFEIKPRRGEYLLLDNECKNMVRHTIFTTPTKAGKGILVTPTVDENILLGPTSEFIDDKEYKGTSQAGISAVIKEATRNVKSIPLNKVITSFCGLRAVGNSGDFIINSPKKGFINAAGIESPGLSASPAIALMIEEIITQSGESLKKKESFSPYRDAMHGFKELSIEEKNEIIKKDPSYGKIVCRCETVTEGEIVNAIRKNPKPLDLDGVKRRTRAQMGRCQGGFCSPYIMKLLSQELGISIEEITKNGGNSRIITGRTKEEI